MCRGSSGQDSAPCTALAEQRSADQPSWPLIAPSGKLGVLGLQVVQLRVAADLTGEGCLRVVAGTALQVSPVDAAADDRVESDP